MIKAIRKFIFEMIFRCRAHSPLHNQRCIMTRMEHRNPVYGHHTEDHSEFWC